MQGVWIPSLVGEWDCHKYTIDTICKIDNSREHTVWHKESYLEHCGLNGIIYSSIPSLPDSWPSLYSRNEHNIIKQLYSNNREGNGNPLQYSCLENPMDRGAWWAAVHQVVKSWTRLSDLTFTFLHWRRKWQATPVFLPGESQGQWNLVGCRLWGLSRLGQSQTRLKRFSSGSSSILQ